MSGTVRFLFVVSLLSSFPLYGQDKAAPVCSCEIQFTNCKPNINPSETLNLNLFSTVSQPSGCLPADIRVSAAFYDSEENLICSGVMSDNIVTQALSLQSTNLEFQPLNVLEFVKVKTPLRPAGKRFFCMNLEGNAEVPQTEILRAAILRIRATILPRSGGVQTAECRVALNVR